MCFFVIGQTAERLAESLQTYTLQKWLVPIKIVTKNKSNYSGFSSIFESLLLKFQELLQINETNHF